MTGQTRVDFKIAATRVAHLSEPPRHPSCR